MRRLDRARRYGVAEVIAVAPFAPGGVLVCHLRPDPDDSAGWRTVATSAGDDQRIHVATRGIEMAGGSELVVTDDLQGRWVDGATAIRERQRLLGRLRQAGIAPES